MRHCGPDGVARHHAIAKGGERRGHIESVAPRPEQHGEEIGVGNARPVSEQVIAFQPIGEIAEALADLLARLGLFRVRPALKERSEALVELGRDEGGRFDYD